MTVWYMIYLCENHRARLICKRSSLPHARLSIEQYFFFFFFFFAGMEFFFFFIASNTHTEKKQKLHRINKVIKRKKKVTNKVTKKKQIANLHTYMAIYLQILKYVTAMVIPYIEQDC